MATMVQKDLLFLYGNDLFITYDIKTEYLSENIFRNKLCTGEFITDEIRRFVASSSEPVIAMQTSKRIILFHPIEERVLMEIVETSSDKFNSICFSANGKLFYLLRRSGIYVYDSINLQLVNKYNSCPAKFHCMHSLVCSPDDELLAFADSDGNVNVFEMRTDETKVVYNGIVNEIAFVNNTILAFYDYTREVRGSKICNLANPQFATHHLSSEIDYIITPRRLKNFFMDDMTKNIRINGVDTDESRWCLKHDGFGMYALKNTGERNLIGMYELTADDMVDLKWVKPMNLDIPVLPSAIVNVSYQCHNLVDTNNTSKMPRLTRLTCPIFYPDFLTMNATTRVIVIN